MAEDKEVYDIQELHARYDNWIYDCESEDIILIDYNKKELRSINVSHLIELWFDEKDNE